MKPSDLLDPAFSLTLMAILCIGFDMKSAEIALVLGVTIGAMLVGANVALRVVLRDLKTLHRKD